MRVVNKPYKQTANTDHVKLNRQQSLYRFNGRFEERTSSTQNNTAILKQQETDKLLVRSLIQSAWYTHKCDKRTRHTAYVLYKAVKHKQLSLLSTRLSKLTKGHYATTNGTIV